MEQDLILNRYQPVRTAGSGGFATVQAAFDTRMQRMVAIKCIELPESVTSENDIPGLNEARTAAHLNNQNIVAVYDFQIHGSMAYLIMEYVEGMTLTQFLKEYDDELTLNLITAIFSDIARGVSFAHRHDVLHLDIKPDNILINREGIAKVADFGLAKLGDCEQYGAATGGTIGYMPLEQMRQEDLDGRCDEWSLASILYEMLCGTNPFLAPDLPRAEAAIENAELVLPSLCWDALDEEADDVIFKALDPDRARRYKTVDAFVKAITPELADAKAGRAELAAIINGEPNPADEQIEPEEREPLPPLRDRIPPLAFTIAGRAVGAVGSGVLSAFAINNIPLFGTITNPIAIILIIAAAVVGGILPSVGAGVAGILLGLALCFHGGIVPGILLIAASAAWWWFVGWPMKSAVGSVLAVPLAGCIGFGQIAPLICGYALRPLWCAGNLLYIALLATMLAGCGSGSLIGWDIFTHWSMSLTTDVSANLLAMVTSPGFWLMLGCWLLSAEVISVLRMRPTRLFAWLGIAVGTVILIIGVAGAAQVGSLYIMPRSFLIDLAWTIGAGLLMAAAIWFVPDQRLDRDALGIDEEPVEIDTVPSERR